MWLTQRKRPELYRQQILKLQKRQITQASTFNSRCRERLGGTRKGQVRASLTDVVSASGRVGRSQQKGGVCLFVGYLTSQQHASVSQGRICSDNFTCCHIEIEVADQIFHLTQSQYTSTGPASPSTDPIPPGAWQGSY